MKPMPNQLGRSRWIGISRYTPSDRLHLLLRRLLNTRGLVTKRLARSTPNLRG
jgi:hypothetical protein